MNIRTGLIAAALAAGLATPVFAEGDAAAGEKVFNKCKACHMVGDNAKNRVGPELNNIIGRPASTVEGFKYSDASHEAGENGLVWDEQTLTEYLADPRGFMPGTKMAFAGLRKEEEIANVIAYLQTFSDDGSS